MGESHNRTNKNRGSTRIAWMICATLGACVPGTASPMDRRGADGGVADGDARFFPDSALLTATCADGEALVEGACRPRCPIPIAPVLSQVDDDEIFPLTFEGQGAIEHAFLAPGDAIESAVFSQGTSFSLSGRHGLVRVVARAQGAACASAPRFDATYDVRSTYPPSPGMGGSTAIYRTDPQLVGWATGGQATFGTDVDGPWRNLSNAFGPAGDSAFNAVALGNGGSIVLTFGTRIEDRDGADFAVFENGIVDGFLELGFVEVSSNGTDFARFDSAYRGTTPVSAYGLHSPTLFGGVASSYVVGFGTPFDLAALRNQREVRSGRVDLRAITHVRIVDIVGDGATRDTFGRPIYDPTPTVGSGGFDLDAIGVIHARPH